MYFRIARQGDERKDGRVYQVSLAALFARLDESSLSTRFACHRNHHNARFRLRCSSSWIQRNNLHRKVPQFYLPVLDTSACLARRYSCNRIFAASMSVGLRLQVLVWLPFLGM
jgi:hypothetical protein